jgi:cysteine desulfurase
LLSISAHKLYGPKGMGALYIRKGTKLLPLIRGGDQERRLRAGTQNVPGIVGFGKAAEIALGEMPDEAKRLAQLRDRLIKGILERIDHTRLNGHPQRRLPNNVNIGVEFIEGESMLLALDFEGICVSTGSACTSSSLEPSHVLLAMGIPHERAHGSLRFSLGKWTRDEDIDRVIEVLPGIVDRYRRMSPLLKDKK